MTSALTLNDLNIAKELGRGNHLEVIGNYVYWEQRPCWVYMPG